MLRPFFYESAERKVWSDFRIKRRAPYEREKSCVKAVHAFGSIRWAEYGVF